jgi:hypothetical protein
LVTRFHFGWARNLDLSFWRSGPFGVVPDALRAGLIFLSATAQAVCSSGGSSVLSALSSHSRRVHCGWRRAPLLYRQCLVSDCLGASPRFWWRSAGSLVETRKPCYQDPLRDIPCSGISDACPFCAAIVYPEMIAGACSPRAGTNSSRPVMPLARESEWLSRNATFSFSFSRERITLIRRTKRRLGNKFGKCLAVRTPRPVRKVP